jgi:hypothetical protein
VAAAGLACGKLGASRENRALGADWNAAGVDRP